MLNIQTLPSKKDWTALTRELDEECFKYYNALIYWFAAYPPAFNVSASLIFQRQAKMTAAVAFQGRQCTTLHWENRSCRLHCQAGV